MLCITDAASQRFDCSASAAPDASLRRAFLFDEIAISHCNAKWHIKRCPQAGLTLQIDHSNFEPAWRIWPSTIVLEPTGEGPVYSKPVVREHPGRSRLRPTTRRLARGKTDPYSPFSR